MGRALLHISHQHRIQWLQLWWQCWQAVVPEAHTVTVNAIRHAGCAGHLQGHSKQGAVRASSSLTAHGRKRNITCIAVQIALLLPLPATSSMPISTRYTSRTRRKLEHQATFCSHCSTLHQQGNWRTSPHHAATTICCLVVQLTMLLHLFSCQYQHGVFINAQHVGEAANSPTTASNMVGECAITVTGGCQEHIVPSLYATCSKAASWPAVHAPQQHAAMVDALAGRLLTFVPAQSSCRLRHMPGPVQWCRPAPL